MFLYGEADIGDPWASSVVNVLKAAGDRNKKKAKNQLVNKIQEMKHLPFWEDDMRDPWGSIILNDSKAAGDQKKKGNSQKLIRGQK